METSVVLTHVGKIRNCSRISVLILIVDLVFSVVDVVMLFEFLECAEETRWRCAVIDVAFEQLVLNGLAAKAASVLDNSFRSKSMRSADILESVVTIKSILGKLDLALLLFCNHLPVLSH